MSAASKESDEECETAGTSSMMESTMMEGEEYYHPETTVAWTEKARGSDQLCRICANANEYLIPIFSGEGAEHQLGMKIDKHLPIQVVKQDKLPLHVCYQCASTLIAWHDLHMGCVEAEKKLRQMFPECEEEVEHDSDDDDKADDFYSEPMESEMTEDPLEPSTSAASKPNRPSRSPRKKTVTKAKPKLKLTLVKTPVAILPKGAPKLLQPKEEQTDPDPASERLEELPPYLSKEMSQAPPTGSSVKDGEDVTGKQKTQKPLSSCLCPTCGKTFKSNQAFYQHNKHHHSASLATLVCNICTFQTIFTCSFNRHMRRHKTERTFMCETCGRGFYTRPELTCHLATHSEARPFTCTLCSASFKTAVILRRHEMCLHFKRHDVETAFSCVICNQRCVSKKRLSDHMNTHTGERPYSCDVCHKTFRSQHTFYQHKDVHKAKTLAFACESCDMKCNTKADLNRHKKKHHKKKDLAYPCENCEMSFDSKSGVVIHNYIVHKIQGVTQLEDS